MFNTSLFKQLFSSLNIHIQNFESTFKILLRKSFQIFFEKTHLGVNIVKFLLSNPRKTIFEKYKVIHLYLVKVLAKNGVKETL